MTETVPSINQMRESLIAGINLLFPDIKESADGFVAQPRRTSDPVLTISSEQIDETLAKLSAAKSKSLTEITWDDRAEFSILSLNYSALFERVYDDKGISTHGENAVTYHVGSTSREYTAHLLCHLAENPDVVRTPRWANTRNRMITYRPGNRRNETLKPLEPICLLDAVAEEWRATTLRMTCQRPGTDFTVLANSFLFHVAYNTDEAARLGIHPMFLTRGIQRIRRTKSNAIDAPRQTYDHDLIHHYLMGVAAEIPLLEYLAYYHIAEHFFEKIFNDDLVEQVRKGITDPSFSVRRARDIQSLIKIVTKAQRQVREEGGVNELRALELVLAKFVDFGRLCADLDAWDLNLVKHYRDSGVSFADANRVDLRNPDKSDLAKSLAQRIYRVRNSLVHAKEGQLPKYAPFAHDDDLAVEIPLMRFTAEQIVVAHGKVI
ncbi:hypothetical protein [Yinghuangia sp. YIM S10712]|uniref:hypothetical protein n=1 Tax=Yinghuangia sp. YIM S10712 TaxID=3436930 RepID=UPI003F537C0B